MFFTRDFISSSEVGVVSGEDESRVNKLMVGVGMSVGTAVAYHSLIRWMWSVARWDVGWGVWTCDQ